MEQYLKSESGEEGGESDPAVQEKGSMKVAHERVASCPVVD